MIRTLAQRLALTAALGLLSLSVTTTVLAHGTVQVEDAWSRPLPAVVKNGAVYITFTNLDHKSDFLTGAATDIAERVELHTHRHEDGLMKMRRINEIEIPSDGRVELKPGGTHLMLVGLKRELTPGLVYALTLKFKHAGELEIAVDVQARTPGRMEHGKTMKH